MTPIAPELKALLELQRRDRALAESRARQAAIPGRRRALDQALAKTRASVDRTKHLLDAARLERRRLEKEVEGLASEAARLERQLFDVKTNDEYTAMQHQIAAVKGKRSDYETSILEGMEREESLAAELKAGEAAVADAERGKREGDAALDGENVALDTEIAERTETRDAARTAVPPPVLSKYDRLHGARDGVAVAEVQHGACGACHRALTPHDMQVVKHGEAIHTCDGCGRIVIDPVVVAG